jgi:REP element-mobilizing transposase RayT
MRQSRQRALDLGRFTVSRNRGGRPKGPNPRVRHRSRKPLLDTEPCHVTLKVRAGLPSLRRADVVHELEHAFRRGNERKHFRLVHYSIQADHAHLIVEAKDRDALGRGMKSLAARFARAVNRALQRTGRVLADRYHLRVLTSPRQVRNALAYVLLNARRHAAKRLAQLERRGLKVEPLPSRGTLDGASSARWFAGWRSDVAIDRAPPRPLGQAPAVAEPRTWILRLGWRGTACWTRTRSRALSRPREAKPRAPTSGSGPAQRPAPPAPVQRGRASHARNARRRPALPHP